MTKIIHKTTNKTKNTKLIFLSTVKTLTLLILLSALNACDNKPKNTPEQQLRNTIEQMVEAAKQRSLDGIAKNISNDYQDHNGYKKIQLKKMIQLQLMRNQNIFIHYKINDLQIDGSQASVELSAMMAATQHQLNKKISGISADKHNFSLLFTSPDKQQTWLLTSASWQRD